MAAEDDSDIPDSGAVFTFGKSKFADNLPNKFWVRNDQVRDVGCGDEHTALVAESGRVFTFGSNDWGQLGLGTTTTADRPSCIKSLKTEKVKLVACGRVHTIVATESGKIYAFGANGEGQLGVEDSPASNVPKCIDSLVEQKYKMLSAGADHSVALTEEGAVYVWGGGSEGQLGLKGKTECADPEELPIDDVVTCISCGYYHTAIVTESGDLLTFGESEGGKLGLGDDPDDTDNPQKVELPEKVTSVACGGSHTVALTENGNVYTFGDGPNGQLGHGTHFLQISTPRKLNIKFKVKAISCGENHTSLISDKGQLYTFGDGRHGKLALGQESFSNQFTPQRVKRFSKFTVEKVMCGGCHMICLAKPNKDPDASFSSDDEVIGEPKMNGLLNHSLRPDGSIDLNNSVTARDRRRKTNESFKNDLNRTLPPLAGAHKVTPDQLHQTVPPVKSRRIESTSKHPDGHRSEDEVHEDIIKPVNKENEESSPKSLPRPLPRRQAGLTAQKSDDEEEETGSEEEEELTHSRTLPQAPIPPPRALPKLGESDSEADAEDDEEEPKGKKTKEKKPKKKKEKKAGMDIFGRKKTGISDDEEEEEEEGEDEEEEKTEEETKVEKKDETEEKKKDKKKDKDKKKKKEDKEGEKEEEDKEEQEEEEKDKKKDKKGKGKKDKKKDKKKNKKEEEEDKEATAGEDEEKKEEKDKTKSKKKDKKKKEKDKDKNKEKDEQKEEKGEKDEENDTETEENKEEKKEDEKPPEPPKKKSRTCTIL